MTCTDGIYIGDRRIEAGDCTGPQSARAILLEPARSRRPCSKRPAAASSARGWASTAARWPWSRTSARGTTSGWPTSHTAEDLIKVKRVPVDVVLPDGYAVLKADDPLVAGMAEYCKGKVIFFARDPSDPVIVGALGPGGRAAFVRDGAIVLAEGPREEVLLASSDVPLTYGGRVAFQVENALAAAAACWGLGVPPEAIRAGLASFDSDPDRAPGRFNVLKADGATVIARLRAQPLGDARARRVAAAFPDGRRTVVLSAAGDRSDAVIIRQARILADAFDEVILYEEASPDARPGARGRSSTSSAAGWPTALACRRSRKCTERRPPSRGPGRMCGRGICS